MTYSSKSNFVAKLVESTNAKFRITNTVVLGKTESWHILVENIFVAGYTER